MICLNCFAMQKVTVKKGIVLAALGLIVAGEVWAQQPTTTRRRATTDQQQPDTANPLINPATGNAVEPPPPADSGTADKASLRPDNIFGTMDTVKKSLRNDGVVEHNLIKDRQPLAYQYIREDDAIWGKRVWRELDIRQKMNMPFRYAADADNGNQRFINILINAIRKGEVTAFNPIDDRFTTPMSLEEIVNTLQGKQDTIRVVDPVTGKETVQVYRNDFNPESVQRFRIKEEWVFDKQTSTMYVRIIGIAPEKSILNADGSVRAYAPLFWLYYPDLRPILARYDVYNPKNYMMRMSWEDLFEMRMFASHIIKEDNTFDRSIKDYIRPGDNSTEAGVRRLLEGQRIKNEIFNWEQDVWAY
jgi:gliding motility associated protien GldN